MAGVRIRHPKERNCTMTVVDGTRSYKEPIMCPRCFKMHVFKTYHLDLDEVGAVIVSETVWDRLKRDTSQPFILDGKVDNPPSRVLDLTANPVHVPVVEHQPKR